MTNMQQAMVDGGMAQVKEKPEFQELVNERKAKANKRRLAKAKERYRYSQVEGITKPKEQRKSRLDVIYGD